MRSIARLCAAFALAVAALSAPLTAVGQASAPTIVRDVIYGHKDGMALTYDVFKPANANRSAAIYMVSGGWVSRWQAAESRIAGFQGLLDKGITVIAVHHGSAPRYKVPEAAADVQRAVRHIHANAATFGVDQNRLGVFGGSAGGHLSLMLGLKGDDGNPQATDLVERASSRIKAVVAYYPPVDLRQMTGPNDRFPALDFNNSLAAGISPILFVDAKDPPTLIVHGDADTLVNVSNGRLINASLQTAGAKTKLIIIPGGDHGFTNREHRAQADAAMVQWFVENL